MSSPLQAPPPNDGRIPGLPPPRKRNNHPQSPGVPPLQRLSNLSGTNRERPMLLMPLMEPPMDPVRPRYLRTPDAAVHLGLSARTLEKHRCYGTGPIYRKLGGRIVYALADLDAWAEVGTRRSTSDPGAGTIHPARRMRSDGPVRR